ncbi:MAG: methyltransferase domain-containing protein [candidate division WOR-3 bacterium]|nr:methyltransferase domain-containing protein [candidate division WOR-3 bacterium]
MSEPRLSPSRVLRPREDARSSYNRLARWYDLLAGASEARLCAAGLEALAVREGESALEIGFGTGHALLDLARAAGTEGRVFGIDISDRMVARARARVADAGLAGCVELVQGDAVSLPWPDARFDAAFMAFTLELFDTPDIPVVLAECRRVLKPGGRLGVVAMARRRPGSLMVRLYEWAHRRFPAAVDCRPIPIRALVERSGFVVGRVEESSTWGLPVDIVVGIKMV